MTTTLSEHVAAVWRYVDYFEWADAGTFPVAGGVLNQSAVFMRLYRVWRNASRLYKTS